MIRTALLSVLVASTIAACGAKKAPTTPPPTNAATEAAPGGGSASESDVKDEAKPDDADDAQKMGADPCDGGE